MERLLLIAERYILTVEESHVANRAIPPHGASFHGHPLTLYVTCENPKMDFNILVSVVIRSNLDFGISLNRTIIKYYLSPIKDDVIVKTFKI